MNIFQAIMQARANPMAIISKRFNIPPELQSTKNGQGTNGKLTKKVINANIAHQGILCLYLSVFVGLGIAEILPKHTETLGNTTIST